MTMQRWDPWANMRSLRSAMDDLLERSFINQVERARTVADAAGRFRFDNNRSHLIQLEAQLDGAGRSERRTIRLWYRAQNHAEDAPLVLAPRG